MSNNRSAPKKSVPGLFNDQAYVSDLVLRGQYPKIHDNMHRMIYGMGLKGTYMDLGSCTGLLAHWIVEMQKLGECVAIEGNPADHERRVKHDLIHYYNFYVDQQWESKLCEVIAKHNVKYIIARRVFPEISCEEPEYIEHLSSLFFSMGIEMIFIEGRVRVKRPAAKLWNVDLEYECFRKQWEKVETYRQIIAIKPRVL